MNKIDQTANLIGDVCVGTNNYIGPNVVIIGPVKIGNNNKIFHNCVIGTPAQHIDIDQNVESENNRKRVINIGDNNVIREFTTIHKPTNNITRIHNNCYIMAYNHIPHDCEIFDRVILTNNCQISGHTKILEYAVIGLSTVIHQYSTIGCFSMVGMGSVITKDIYPFLKVSGNPARVMGINIIGMQRNGFNEDEIEEVNRWISISKNNKLKLKEEIYKFKSERIGIQFKMFFKLRNKNRTII